MKNEVLTGTNSTKEKCAEDQQFVSATAFEGYFNFHLEGAAITHTHTHTHTHTDRQRKYSEADG